MDFKSLFKDMKACSSCCLFRNSSIKRIVYLDYLRRYGFCCQVKCSIPLLTDKVVCKK